MTNLRSSLAAEGQFYGDEEDRADREVYPQAPVFLEHGVTHGLRQMRHEEEIDGVAGEDGGQGVEEIGESVSG